MANVTPNLKLPLDLYGHVPTEQAIVEAFKKIDEFAGSVGEGGSGGSPSTAGNVAVDPIPGVSGTDVQTVLAELAARIAALETAP